MELASIASYWRADAPSSVGEEALQNGGLMASTQTPHGQQIHQPRSNDGEARSPSDGTATHEHERGTASTPVSETRESASTWQTKRLLILGTTYPAYSNKYIELVCTGAIEEDTKRIVRVHPLPKRYLDEGQAFKTFQRIEVPVQPNREDARPESVRIDFRHLRPLDEVPARDHEARRRYIEDSPSLMRSVEELQDANRKSAMSLGAIVPKSIDGIRIRPRDASEEAEWRATERRFLGQQTLPLIKPPKKIAFPKAEFLIRWTCADDRCTGHESGLKSWGIHELYRKLSGDIQRDEKTMAQLERMLDVRTKDLFFFLGTFHNHRTTFGLMDVYASPKLATKRQLGLFAA
jgi:hypothetical protein